MPHRLVDILRAGKAPSLIRQKGAEGSLPVSIPEKLEILIALCDDAEEAVRTKALATLRNSSEAEQKEALAANPALGERLRILLGSDAEETVQAGAGGGQEAAGAAPERQTLHQRINAMNVAEKIKTALMGKDEERMLLVRDSNKVVARAVIESPKLSDQEAENIASMKSVPEEVLRLIAMNRRFIRNYGVARNLVNNPRTPIDSGLPLINRLNDRDLKELARNKNVAEVIRSMATRLIRQKEEASKPRLPGKH